MRMDLSVRALVAVFPLGVACARSSPLPEIETQLTRPSDRLVHGLKSSLPHPASPNGADLKSCCAED